MRSALERTKSIILSMTPQERTNPAILNVSRKNRIARGAGVDISGGQPSCKAV